MRAIDFQAPINCIHCE